MYVLSKRLNMWWRFLIYKSPIYSTKHYTILEYNLEVTVQSKIFWIYQFLRGEINKINQRWNPWSQFYFKGWMNAALAFLWFWRIWYFSAAKSMKKNLTRYFPSSFQYKSQDYLTWPLISFSHLRFTFYRKQV